MATRCTGTNVDGSPCSAQPRPGRAWCIWHDPATQRDREQWRKAGGHGRSNKARAKKQLLVAEILTTDELLSYLGVVFRGVIHGKVDPPIATAAASVARTMNEIRKTAELESRLEEVEKVLGLEKAS